MRTWPDNLMLSHSFELVYFPQINFNSVFAFECLFSWQWLIIIKDSWQLEKKHFSFFLNFSFLGYFFHFQKPCTAPTPHKSHLPASVSMQSCIFLWVNLQVVCVAATLEVWKVMERRTQWGGDGCFTIISGGPSAQNKYLSKSIDTLIIRQLKY